VAIEKGRYKKRLDKKAVRKKHLRRADTKKRVEKKAGRRKQFEKSRYKEVG
jgi:hypothetical protein